MGQYILHKAKNIKAKDKKSLVSYYKNHPAEIDKYWKSKQTNRIQLEVDRLHREYKKNVLSKDEFLASLYLLVEQLLGFTLHTEPNYYIIEDWSMGLPKEHVRIWIKQLDDLVIEWADSEEFVEVSKYRNLVRLKRLLQSKVVM